MRSENRAAIDRRILKAYRLLYADERVQMKRDFCDRIGLLPQNFSMLERGDLSATVDNIYNLATSLIILVKFHRWQKLTEIMTD